MVKSTGLILVRNAAYLGHNLVPMVVLMAPFMAILIQLVANYGYQPAKVGDVELLTATFEKSLSVPITDVRLDLPAGVVLEAPPVRTSDRQVGWRLRAEGAGDPALTVTAGDERLVKPWTVGGDHKKIPVLRTKAWWEALLYPGEDMVPSDSSFYELRMHIPPRELPYLPDGELGVLTIYMVLSLAAGFALKDVFGVTL